MNLNTISTAELAAEMQRREKHASALVAKREKLVEQLAEIDAEIASLGGASDKRGGRRAGKPGRPAAASPGGERRRRAKNEISLGDALAGAMEVRAVVSPAEASDLVKANGYKSTSKNFNMMVSNALAKDERFKRISRGQYERVA